LHSTDNNTLTYPYGTFAIIFTPELQFSYLVTKKNVLLSLGGCNFYTIANIATKFADYVA